MTCQLPEGATCSRNDAGDVMVDWVTPEGWQQSQSLDGWLRDNCTPGTEAEVIENGAGQICLVAFRPPTSYEYTDTRTAARRFRLVRHEDVSGVSGTGVVAHGAQFPDGTVALRWAVPGMPATWNLFDSIEQVELLNGHQGKTEVEWID